MKFKKPAKQIVDYLQGTTIRTQPDVDTTALTNVNDNNNNSSSNTKTKDQENVDVSKDTKTTNRTPVLNGLGDLKYDYKSFEKVLTDKTLYEKFKVQAEKDLAMENCLFWEVYQEYLRTSDQMFGLKLYHDFIKRDAKNELNIPSRLREELEKTMSQRALRLQDFQSIVKEVKTMLYNHNFKRFYECLKN